MVSDVAVARRARRARPFATLTEAEARRALYIDFEGGKDRPPVLLGTLRRASRGPDPFVFQVVVDPEFAAAGPELLPLIEAIERVVVRAEARDRRIVAWTEHELTVVRAACADRPDLVERFERRFANARLVARRWVNRLHAGEEPADGSLASYLAVIGYRVPRAAEAGRVGDTIRALRPTLRAGRSTTSDRSPG